VPGGALARVVDGIVVLLSGRGTKSILGGLFKMKIPLIEWISGILASFPPARALTLLVGHPGGALTVPLCWVLCRCTGSVRIHDRCKSSTDRVPCQTSHAPSGALASCHAVLLRAAHLHRCTFQPPSMGDARLCHPGRRSLSGGQASRRNTTGRTSSSAGGCSAGRACLRAVEGKGRHLLQPRARCIARGHLSAGPSAVHIGLDLAPYRPARLGHPRAEPQICQDQSIRLHGWTSTAPVVPRIG
jgi:hypothetical protein